ncbi:uncharacterized protein LOC121867728 [Homarus americanus]|nr:uncharacterized protein LOC121867728 [Homarus americanus]XP_042223716.1 uncharacterized protein LOC121867728 [Homarus americanus]XP_042223717.1 uncharacterized protein LOC121867728 [Homarus americanus]
MRVINSGQPQTNVDPVDEGHGELWDGRATRFNNRDERTNVQTVNSDRPPPAYPCQEVCIQCGKKVTEADNDADVTITQRGPESGPGCPCECHKQLQSDKLTEAVDQVSQGHIPPAGPRCLPGCGYSGLPCYNCSLLQEHLEPEGTTTSSQSQTFSPQIYTIELMEPPSGSNTQGSGSRHRDNATENTMLARNRKRTCFSIVAFVIAINVVVGIFRMLMGTRNHYGY